MSLSNKREKLAIAVIFAVTAACLLAQFSQVMIYYDDYGYYSLSYGIAPFQSGHEFTFAELFHFLKEHYVAANGRLLYFGLWLIIYKIAGLTGVRVAATMVVLCVLFLIWKIVKQGQKQGRVLSALVVCSLYWLLSVTLHRQGTYWFTAFFLYVASVVPFLLFCLLYFRKTASQHKLWEIILMTILLFCAAFSQEQWGLTMVLLTLMLIACAKTDNSLRGMHFGFLAAAIMGEGILFFSPGLWGRAARTEASESLIEQIGINTQKAIVQFFSMDFRLILIALFLALIFICGYLWKKDTAKWAKTVDAISIALYGGLSLIYATKNPVWVTALSMLDSHMLYLLVAGGICAFTIILTLLQVTRYYLAQQNRMCLIQFYTAFLAIACLGGVTDQPVRLFLPPLLVLFVLITQGICESSDLFANKRYGRVLSALVVFCIVVAGVKNGLQIYNGYADNKPIHEYNDAVFQQASRDIAEGKTVERIYLKKLPDIIYSCDMVYTPGFEFMKFWMCNYYEIPYEVEFTYSDDALFMGNLKSVGTTLETADIQYGIHPDGWVEPEAKLQIAAGDEGSIHLKGYYNQEITGNEIISVYQGENLLAEYVISGPDIEFDIPCEPNSAVELTIKSNFSFQADPPDIRELSFILSSLVGE